MRKTKIIATLGPATSEPEMLRRLMETGVNIFRLNMSHAPHDWVRKIVPEIRQISAQIQKHVGILLDTQGPAIRTGDLAAKLDLKPGDVFTFTVRGEQSEELHSVDVNYDDLVNDIGVGDIVLVDNGVIRMKVLSKEEKKLKCEVLTSGVMGSRRHINLPGIKVNLPALTEKDLADIDCGLSVGIDFVALSFTREAKDVELLRNLLKTKQAPDVKIIAKIEDQLAVKNLEDIIMAADAVMVARGDLGIECPYEELPMIQRRIVKTCLHYVKPVIVATHMLESMISSPMPTRAEITDVANAVFEQADAIMLSGETTVGKYPVECVEVLDRVAERTERSGNAGYTANVELEDDRENVVEASVHLANRLRSYGLFVFTRTGYLAKVTAGLRPRYSRIFAFAPTTEVCRKMTLNYGVIPIQLDFGKTPEDTIQAAIGRLKELGMVHSGAKVVLVSDILLSAEMINSVQLRVIP